MKKPMHFHHLILCLVVAAIGLAFAGQAEAADRVAIIHVYATDAHSETTWKKSDLKTHFDGPILNFWTELSHGVYRPEFTFYEYPLPVTLEQLKGTKEHYVIDAIPRLYLSFVVTGRSAPSSNCSVGHGGAPELSRYL